MSYKRKVVGRGVDGSTSYSNKLVTGIFEHPYGVFGRYKGKYSLYSIHSNMDNAIYCMRDMVHRGYNYDLYVLRIESFHYNLAGELVVKFYD